MYYPLSGMTPEKGLNIILQNYNLTYCTNFSLDGTFKLWLKKIINTA